MRSGVAWGKKEEGRKKKGTEGGKGKGWQKEEAGVNRWIDPGLGRGRLPTLPLSQYHRRGGV